MVAEVTALTGGMVLPKAVQPLAMPLDSLLEQPPTLRLKDRFAVGNCVIQKLYQLCRSIVSI
jgi:hypothetical protein